MGPEHDEAQREKTVESLERIQAFNIEDLPREADLGKNFNFQEAVKPAQRLIGLYQKIPISVLEDFPLLHLQRLQQHADADYNRLGKMLKFDPKQQDAFNTRTSLIDKLDNAYVSSFEKLQTFITYGVSKAVDFQRLENEGHATIQRMDDRFKEQLATIEGKEEEAERIIQDIRNVAAEEGVSQQAKYFKTASNKHNEASKFWMGTTTVLAIVLVSYALGSIFLHKWALLKPESVFESIQLGVSKVLVFTVISYMLYLSTRNFLAHKHNSIVNAHRQNALMTYRAIVGAAKEGEKQDIILTHASACMFSPQPTGYAKDSGPTAPSAKSIVEMIPKSLDSAT